MKKLALIGVVALRIFSIIAHAQSESPTIKRLRLDSVTTIGKPNGEEVSEEIDKDGGKVFSADSKMELIVPEGALSKKRKIQIQSITNLVANGRGNAYKMEPSGLQFQKPVTLIYHYSEDELNGTSAEFKGIAWQDEKGKWSSMDLVVLDTAAKTITTQINHFSSYGSFDRIVLLPYQARVKVEKSIQLEIHFAIADVENYTLPPTIPAPEWAVNGINGGNGFVGTIVPTGTNTNHSKYTAPVSMPDDNPVAVSAKIRGIEFTFNRRTFRDPSLVSHLLIYDKAYRVSMNFWVDNSEDGMCTMRMEDRCEFTVLLEGTRSMIKEINNQNLQVRLNPCRCVYTWTNRPLPGPLNPIGASRIDITPASVPSVPFRKVRIMLTHGHSPLPQFRNACPVRGGVPFAAGYGVYLPPMIEFEANNEMEQRFTLNELTRGSMRNENRHGLTIVLKQNDD